MDPASSPRGVNDKDQAEPFLKWPGGKRLLVPHLRRLLPRQYNRYFEPFLGSGALFFALQPSAAVLSDKNTALIDCFTQIRDNASAVVRRLNSYRNSEADYYRIRSSVPRTAYGRAARFIYLVNLSFNGIYRVNFDGQFNVPYGHRSHRPVCEEEKIQRASTILRAAALRAADFESTVELACAGDLVYLDPPYTVAHNNNGFIRYNSHLFSWEDQERLADAAHRLADRGCHVIVSNAFHEGIRRLYRNFTAHEVTRPSAIAADTQHRSRVSEYIFTTESCS